MFNNRADAGHELAQNLSRYKNSGAIVLAVPRGGVPVACVVAKALSLPLDLLLVKKLGHPTDPEYAIGAASLTDRYVDPRIRIEPAYIERATQAVRRRLQEMQLKWRGDRPALDLKGKVVIVVDDGIATGNTLLAAVPMLRRQGPAKIIIAAPVASPSAVSRLAQVADEVSCVRIPRDFHNVGTFYRDFEQVSDDRLLEILHKSCRGDNGKPAPLN